MPFDNATGARPYMRETTEALASLVATNPAEEVLRAVAVELAHRTRPGARRLRAELEARFRPIVVPVIHGELAPEAREEVVSITRVHAADPVERVRWILQERENMRGAPVARVRLILDGWRQTIIAARALPLQYQVNAAIHAALARAELRRQGASVERKASVAPVATGARKGAKIKAHKPTREGNQAARGSYRRAVYAAMTAAENALGRDSGGTAVWPGVPGAAHMIRVPAEMAQYVTLGGKLQREARERVLPAPQYWPGGVLPGGYEDLGQAQPARVRVAQPGSKEWMKHVKLEWKLRAAQLASRIEKHEAAFSDANKNMIRFRGMKQFKAARSAIARMRELRRLLALDRADLSTIVID